MISLFGGFRVGSHSNNGDRANTSYFCSDDHPNLHLPKKNLTVTFRFLYSICTTPKNLTFTSFNSDPKIKFQRHFLTQDFLDLDIFQIRTVKNAEKNLKTFKMYEGARKWSTWAENDDQTYLAIGSCFDILMCLGNFQKISMRTINWEKVDVIEITVGGFHSNPTPSKKWHIRFLAQKWPRWPKSPILYGVNDWNNRHWGFFVGNTAKVQN